MNETERAVLNALIELEDAVTAMSTAQPKPDLHPLIERLDVLTRQLPVETAPDLMHYLRRKSYAKARQWLEGRDAERGSCGH